ncbi:MAG: [Fe-Fe] hydrogenase large subunit C-terminal domain-containing protein [Bacteroidales bacterium]
MQIEVEINNNPITAVKGQTILDALRENGIKIPTLCRLEDFTPTGACRLCVVEVEGMDNLVPACSYPLEQGMNINTHSRRVIEARKMIVELLLSNHPDDCLYCERNGNCELQNLAAELNIRERWISGKKNRAKLDLSSSGIVHDPAKCVLCGRCIRICEDIVNITTLEFKGRGNSTSVSTALSKGLNFSSCIQCGQCIQVCPTGALHEKSYFDLIQEAIGNKNETTTVAHYSPSVVVTLAEEFGLKPGKQIVGLINAALRRIGFDKVFDGSFGSDIYIMEQAAELEDRLDKEENLPLLSSSCPAWIKDVEQSYPDLLPYLSTVKSPEQISGAIIKRFCLESKDQGQNDVFSVAITSCPAKKFEAQRQEMTHKGIPDIDAVLTTRELARLIKLYGIDIHALDPESADEPFHKSSSAGKLLASAGGTGEAVLRTLYRNVTGKDMIQPKVGKLRGTKQFKEVSQEISHHQVKVAAVSPLKEVREILQDIRNEGCHYHYMEVMACPGGCVNGGGQPFVEGSKTIRNRIKAIHGIDEKSTVQSSHNNTMVDSFYSKYLGKPFGENSRKILHTSYTKRDILL